MHAAQSTPHDHRENAVKLDKFSKQLRRDIAAHPKKAALLGLMAFVALYFWAPLLRKFVSTAEKNGENVAAMPASLLSSSPVISQPISSRGAAKFNWEKAQDLIRRDSHMVSASFDPTWIEPFGSSRTTPGNESAEDETSARTAEVSEAKAVSMLAALQPQDLGIVLGGTMIGPRGRLATINGEPCREGDVIAVGLKTDKSVVFDFQVLKITPQSVQVGNSGKVFTLQLATPKLGSGDEFPSVKTK